MEEAAAVKAAAAAVKAATAVMEGATRCARSNGRFLTCYRCDESIRLRATGTGVSVDWSKIEHGF